MAHTAGSLPALVSHVKTGADGLWHTAAPEAETRPVGQAVQAVELLADANVPALHGVQDDELLADAYVPAPHAVHVAAPYVPKVPGRQATQFFVPSES